MRKNFKEQIKDPRWQRRRLEIMQKDDFTCQMCGCKDKTLNVHHLYYEGSKMYWEYSNKEDIDTSISLILKKGITMIELFAISIILMFEPEDCLKRLFERRKTLKAPYHKKCREDRDKKIKETGDPF